MAWVCEGAKCIVSRFQRFGCVPALLDQVQQMAGMRAANESALRTALAQSIGQRQAAHDMAGADL
jgi:hypothetical protein